MRITQTFLNCDKEGQAYQIILWDHLRPYKYVLKLKFKDENKQKYFLLYFYRRNKESFLRFGHNTKTHVEVAVVWEIGTFRGQNRSPWQLVHLPGLQSQHRSETK